MDKTDETWHDGTERPPVNEGSECEFIIAVYRARTGKVYSFAATYMNAHRLQYDDCPKGKSGFCDDCEDGCPTTGWFTEIAEDDSSSFHSLSLDVGDQLKGWRHVPQWPGSSFT